MSVDLEEWFQVTNFERAIPRLEWERCQWRIQETLPRLLDLFAQYQVRATFFVLGWIAQRHSALIRRIHEAGHEIASHGYDHRLVTKMSYAEFRQQLCQSRTILEQVTGKAVLGFRAPSYALYKETHWIIDELLQAGFTFDSSIFPYGDRAAPGFCDSRVPCVLSRGGGNLTEYPLSVVTLCGIDTPIAGGGYFRLLPYQIIRQGVRKLNAQGKPAIMFFHPWEFDPGQPRVRTASWLSRLRHYLNLEHNEDKLEKLVQEFRFASIRDVFWNSATCVYDTVPHL